VLEQKRNPVVCAWFGSHARSKLRGQFGKISLTKNSQLPKFEPGVPILALCNHASWWDAMLAMYLSRYVLKKKYYGVMAEEELRRYGIFRLVGVYSVARGSAREAKTFLEYTERLLKNQSAILWLYPQGDIISAEQTDLVFKSGFVHVASRLGRVHLLKMTASYDFWNESKPELVIDLLPLETVSGLHGASALAELRARVASEMSLSLERLRRIVRNRRSDELTPLLTAEAGTHPVYDAYRRVKAALTGSSFRKTHGPGR